MLKLITPAQRRVSKTLCRPSLASCHPAGAEIYPCGLKDFGVKHQLVALQWWPGPCVLASTLQPAASCIPGMHSLDTDGRIYISLHSDSQLPANSRSMGCTYPHDATLLHQTSLFLQVLTPRLWVF